MNETISSTKIDDAACCANLADLWRVADSPIYRVVDEDGVNVASAQVRRLTADTWLYVDDSDGYSTIGHPQVTGLWLVAEAEHTPLGWDRNGKVIKL